MIRRRSRALPGGRLTTTEHLYRSPTWRLLKRGDGTAACKEGAHGGTSGSPVLRSPQSPKRDSGRRASSSAFSVRIRRRPQTPGGTDAGGDSVVVRTSDPGPPRAEAAQLRDRGRSATRALQARGSVREPPAVQDRGAGADRGDDGRRGAGRLRAGTGRLADRRVRAEGRGALE